MRVHSNSIAGTGKVNEDRLLVKVITKDSLLAVLADGMGGLYYGDLAAALAVDAVNATFAGNGVIDESTFGKAISMADRAITSESERLGTKMGCAITIAWIKHSQLWFSHIGNVRIFIRESGNWKCLTEDHTYVDEARGTYLTRCLKGTGLREKPLVQHVDLEPNWAIRICTDGFYNHDSTDDASVIEISDNT